MALRTAFAPLVAGFTVAIAHAAGAPTLDAQVVRVEIDERAPFAGGHAFGDTGPYEKIVGRLHIEVDPKGPANARVSDLGLVPTNERGRVEVWTDFFLLKPVDPARGNGRLLYDVANRGNKVALGTFNGGRGNDPATAADAGDGFLMEEGYSILWSGWSGDVAAGNDRVQIGVPVARNADGSAIVGRIYAELESTVYGLYIANVLEPDSDARDAQVPQPALRLGEFAALSVCCGG